MVFRCGICGEFGFLIAYKSNINNSKSSNCIRVTKENLNTKISTEAKFVGVNDRSSLILWTYIFLGAQRYKVEQNILYQDNKSTILL